MPDSAWNEYKILQDKVDRIADFRFRIKSWMVTIVLAISFGGYATGRLPPIAYSGLAFVVVVFYLFEQSQAAWHNAFVSRLLKLEKEIAFLEAREAMAAPTIEALKRATGPRIGPAINQEKRRIKSIRLVGWIRHSVISSSHGLFYCSTLIVVAFMWWLSYSRPVGMMHDRADRVSAAVQINADAQPVHIGPSGDGELDRQLERREEASRPADEANKPNNAVKQQTPVGTDDHG